MPNKRPNILFIFSDEHSYRYMGHISEEEGGEPVDTPAFDRLASQGTVFTNAYCQMPLCTPSRLSMLTGKEVRKSGAWSNSSVLRPELKTIPSVLRDNGYETGLIGKMHLGGTQQFVGFQYRPYGDMTGKCGHQDEPLPDGSDGIRGRTTDVGVTQIPESQIQDQVVCHETLAFIRETENNTDKPWFACMGMSRPHFPLTAPKRHIDKFWPKGVTEPMFGASGEAYDHPMSVGMRKGFHVAAIEYDEMMYARACYFACVSYLDEILGDFFSSLENSGLLENTIIVYSTDHGEMAGEHGTWWKNGWYEGCTRVPFIISTPDQRKGLKPANRINTPVALLDIFPTLLSFAGVEAPDDIDGIDLSESVTNGTEPIDRPVYTDALTPRWGEGTEFRSVRKGDYKYVIFRNSPPLAFDLKNDPGEQHNLLNDETIPEEVEKLARFANESIDFEEAAKEFRERDGDLKKEYRMQNKSGTNNLYMLNTGRIISAEDPLYNPTIVSESPEEMFGEDWQEQN